MPTLAQAAAGGRDNNLALLRLAAALAVLVSHAWPISLGEGAVQPLKELTGETLGTHAVTIFFVLSGLLIAASYARSPDPRRFWIARIARLYPGLIFANLILVFLLGPLVTRLDLGAYFSHRGTWDFLWGNSLILRPVYPLPGVFEGNPHPTVHGSIWTLRYELACYAMVAVIGGLGLLRARWALPAVVGLAYLLFWVLSLRVNLPQVLLWFGHLAYPFLLGVFAWQWRERLPLDLRLAAILAGVAWLAGGLAIGPALQTLAIAYGALWLAYVPAGRLRAFNRLGDYSYGTYIYAFPVQGLVVWLWGPGDPLLHCLLAVPPTLLLAVLSWHLIEAPALALGRAWAARGAVPSASASPPSQA